MLRNQNSTAAPPTPTTMATMPIRNLLSAYHSGRRPNEMNSVYITYAVTMRPTAPMRIFCGLVLP